MKPDFLVIGAMKCGTSTVCAYLEDHPGVFMVPGREPNFFSVDARFAEGPAAYEALFDGAAPGQLRGEGSNTYASGPPYEAAPARIHAYAPEMRLIYMVRHPVKRILSSWIQKRVDKGDEMSADVDAAIDAHFDAVVAPSFYWRNLQAYRALFPDAQIFVGFMEDMAADRDAFFARLTDFLGLPPAPPRRPHANPSAAKRVPGRTYSAINALPFGAAAKRLVPAGLRRAVKDRLLSVPGDAPRMRPETRARLAGMLRADTEAFLRHTGRPADFWDL